METCGARGTVKVADFSLTATNNIFKSSTHTHTRTYVDLVVQKTCPHISTCGAQSPKFPAPSDQCKKQRPPSLQWRAGPRLLNWKSCRTKWQAELPKSLTPVQHLLEHSRGRKRNAILQPKSPLDGKLARIPIVLTYSHSGYSLDIPRQNSSLPCIRSIVCVHATMRIKWAFPKMGVSKIQNDQSLLTQARAAWGLGLSSRVVKAGVIYVW